MKFLSLLSLLLIPLLFSGCGTTPQKATFNTAAGTDATVRLAMTGWGAYVATAHPGTNIEAQVQSYFGMYQQAEIATIKAGAALLNNPAATNVFSSAVIAETAAQSNLITLISSITNAVTK